MLRARLTRLALPLFVVGLALPLGACSSSSPTTSLPTSGENLGEQVIATGKLTLAQSGTAVAIRPADALPTDHIAYGQMRVFDDTSPDADKYAASTKRVLGAFEADSVQQAFASFNEMTDHPGWGAVARCDRFIVWTTAVDAPTLVRLTTAAFPGCRAKIQGGTSKAAQDPAAAPAPAPAPDPTPEPVDTTPSAPPRPLPKTAVVSGWDDTQSEVVKGFTISGFRVHPTSDGATLTITVTNRTGRSLSLNPGVTYEDADGGEYDYGDATSCWTFAPHETDTLHLQGSGLDDPTGVFTKRTVESGTC